MTRLSDAQIADVKDRVDLADLAMSLGAVLRVSGKKWVGSCPICGGKKLATRFEIIGDGWVCAVCEDGGDAIRLIRKATGCSFTAAIEKLGGPRPLTPEEEKKLADDRAAKERREKDEADSYRRAELAACRRLWDAAYYPTAQCLGRYWEARRLLLPVSAPIRQAPDVPFFHGEELDERGRKQPVMIHRGPAQLAAFLDNDDRFVGVHITWLAQDWRSKAEIVDPETGELLNPKKMRGSKKGSHIVLRQPPANMLADAQRAGRMVRLFMGEGIETTGQVGTSLKRMGRLDALDIFWASGDLGNLGGAALGTIAHPTLKTPKGRPQRVPGPDPDMAAPAIRIPDYVTHLVLLGDGDSEPFLTRTTLDRAKARYARPGLEIATLFAPDGEDFNSMARAG